MKIGDVADSHVIRMGASVGQNDYKCGKQGSERDGQRFEAQLRGSLPRVSELISPTSGVDLGFEIFGRDVEPDL